MSDLIKNTCSINGKTGKLGLTGKLALLFILACLMVIGSVDKASADEDRSTSSYNNPGTTFLGFPTMFTEGEASIGLGYVSNWAGGVNLTGSYFFFDDVAMQVDISSLRYNYGPGSTNFTYVDIAGVYHQELGKSKQGYPLGFYAGLGIASGKATWSGGSSNNFGGIFWLAGFEMKYSSKVRLQAGFGSLGLGIGANYAF